MNLNGKGASRQEVFDWIEECPSVCEIARDDFGMTVIEVSFEENDEGGDGYESNGAMEETSDKMSSREEIFNWVNDCPAVYDIIQDDFGSISVEILYEELDEGFDSDEESYEEDMIGFQEESY